VTGRSRLGGALVLALAVVVAGCSDKSNTVEPIHAEGTVSAPARPIVVDPLPDGWSVESVETRDFSPPMQSLYLPPGSTPEHGPALAVGQFPQETGYTTCNRGRPSGVTLDGPEPAPARLTRLGALTTIQGEISTDTPGYVFGRDLTVEQVLAAALAAHYPGWDEAEPPAGISALGLPDGFRRVATAPVVPNSTHVGETIRLTNADGTNTVTIAAYVGDAAADLMTRFWSATVLHEPCGNTKVRTVRNVDGTNVIVAAGAPQEIVDQVARGLRATDQKGFDAFRAKISDVPATALLDCLHIEPGPDVILEGTQNEVRWLIGIAPVGDRGFTCEDFVIDGQRQGASVGSGLGPSFAAPGTYNIDVLAGTSLIREGEALTTVAGTAPLSATRVVITTGSGSTTEAKLVAAGDPAKQYFGAFLREAGALPPSWTIVAYDAAGNEVGRHNPVPIG
jgi:hypothetical protein